MLHCPPAWPQGTHTVLSLLQVRPSKGGSAASPAGFRIPARYRSQLEGLPEARAALVSPVRLQGPEMAQPEMSSEQAAILALSWLQSSEVDEAEMPQAEMAQTEVAKADLAVPDMAQADMAQAESEVAAAETTEGEADMAEAEMRNGAAEAGNEGDFRLWELDDFLLW